MKSSKYIIIILLLVILGLLAKIFFFTESYDNTTELEKLKDEKKEQILSLEIEKKEIILKNDSIIKFKIDSMSNLPKQIKYIPYEKIYVNRSVDDNIDILLSDNKKAKKPTY